MPLWLQTFPLEGCQPLGQPMPAFITLCHPWMAVPHFSLQTLLVHENGTISGGWHTPDLWMLHALAEQHRFPSMKVGGCSHIVCWANYLDCGTVQCPHWWNTNTICLMPCLTHEWLHTEQPAANYGGSARLSNIGSLLVYTLLWTELNHCQGCGPMLD